MCIDTSVHTATTANNNNVYVPFVMMADVCAGTRNCGWVIDVRFVYATPTHGGARTSSAAYLSTAVKGASSGTLRLCVKTYMT